MPEPRPNFTEMHGFTKLFSSMLTSTIWREDDKTRIVWITLLALSDFNGNVSASIPGLAALANVSTKDCRGAVAKLLAPDADSRTKLFDGRRIAEIDGGWKILNYVKYRDLGRKLDRTDYLRVKQREYRERQQTSTSEDKPSTLTSVSVSESVGTGVGGVGEGFAEFQIRVGKLYKRKPGDRWSYAEEQAMVEVVGRVNWKAELAVLEKWISNGEGEFTPQSVESFLTGWQRHLDRSRSPKPLDAQKQAKLDKILREFKP